MSNEYHLEKGEYSRLRNVWHNYIQELWREGHADRWAEAKRTVERIKSHPRPVMEHVTVDEIDVLLAALNRELSCDGDKPVCESVRRKLRIKHDELTEKADD